MASKVIASLALVALTLLGGGLLYEYASQASRALEPGGGRPLLRYVAPLNSSYAIYYVVEGCLGPGGPVLAYNATTGSWAPPSGPACRGSLVALPEAVAPRVARVEGG